MRIINDTVECLLIRRNTDAIFCHFRFTGGANLDYMNGQGELKSFTSFIDDRITVLKIRRSAFY